MSKPSQEKIEEWMAKGFEHLQMGDSERAQRIGKRLIKHRHTSGFEILALALADDDEIEEAIKVLEEGVALAPGLWLLWQLLGNYRSDTENYEGAHQAYESALKCENLDQDDEDSVRFNIATLLSRQERYEESLGELERVTGRWMQPRAEALRAHVLHDLGRDDEALAVAREAKHTLDDLMPDWDEEAPVSCESFVSVYEQLGHAFLNLDEREAAHECALKGLDLDRTDRGILALVRHLDDQHSPQAQYFRALIEGDWPDDPDDPEWQNVGFFITYDVVAETPADVLDWVRRFEPEEAHDSLRVAELEEFDDRPDEPLGVYRISGYAMFPREEHD